MSSHEKDVTIPDSFTLISATTVGSDTALPTGTRGLLVGVGGYLDVTMANGDQLDGLPLVPGLNPGKFAEVRTSTDTGAAQNVWAIT